jgi:hypothetical protein
MDPDQPTAEPAVSEDLPAVLRAAALIGAVQALAIALYAVGIGIAALREGRDVAAAPVEIAIYLAFAAGIALIVKGLRNRRHIARGPFVVTQLFGLIVGWTLTEGDGAVVTLLGIGVLLLCLAAIALALNGQLRDALVD